MTANGKCRWTFLAVGCLLALSSGAGAAVTPGGLADPARESWGLGGVRHALTSEPVPVETVRPVAAKYLLPGDATALAAGLEGIDWATRRAETASFPISQGGAEPVAPGADLDKLLEDAAMSESLADIGGDEIGNPLADFSHLSMTPSAYVMLRSGLPGGDALAWSHATETALSYVRPHRNLEFVMNFHGGEGRADSLSGNMVTGEAQLVDDLKVEADSRALVPSSSAYGRMAPAAKTDSAKRGRMVAVGLDLGLLPAVLADVGLSATIMIGESENPGPFVTVATNIEVPNQREHEFTTDSEYLAQIPLLVGGIWHGDVAFSGGFAGNEGGGGGGGGGEEIIPIVPEPIEPVPEPTTMLLLGFGAIIIGARRRRVKR